MLSTRKIRRKIRSINNIKKITRAMEMVSAAKLKKAQARLYALRPFMTKLQTIMDNILSSLPRDSITHPLLRPRDLAEGRRTIGLIVVASNKGLCGGYNTNLLKTASRFIQENPDATIKIVAVGKRVADYFQKQGFNVIQSYPQVPPEIDSQIARQMLEPLIQTYEKGELTEIWLIYTEFVNPMVYKPRVKRLVPISIEQEGDPRLPDEVGTPPSMLFEPEPKIILDLLVPRYIEITFYRLLWESLASEHSARMMAMRNATDNAEEVISDLTLSFNKARQAGITRELLDIVGGAEAMR